MSKVFLILLMARLAFGSPVVLISIDGFRADYFDKYPCPNLHALAKEGVTAKSLISIFPSLTFPNHYSIATGLFAENHGIVGNEIWDPASQTTFSMSNDTEVENPKWWGGEPIWLTAERQGVRAAPFFWVGANAAIQGKFASFHRRYSSSVTEEERVDALMAHQNLPKNERPGFETLYFSSVDRAGHEYGPDSSQVAKAVEKVDSLLGKLIAALKVKKEKYALVVVSDHGMALAEKRIPLYQWISNEVKVVGGGAYAQLWVPAGKEKEWYEKLKTKEHFKIYLKESIPPEFRFRNNSRIGPLLLVADVGWLIQPRLAAFLGVRGAHGYDPKEKVMHAFFTASGPRLKKGVTVESFQNIEVYNLLCRLLEIQPAKNDGNETTLKQLFR